MGTLIGVRLSIVMRCSRRPAFASNLLTLSPQRVSEMHCCTLLSLGSNQDCAFRCEAGS